MLLDFNKLPPEDEIESIVNTMDADECLAAINEARARALVAQKDTDPYVVRVGMFVTRRFRSLRETKTSQGRPKKEVATLDQLFRDL